MATTDKEFLDWLLAYCVNRAKRSKGVEQFHFEDMTFLIKRHFNEQSKTGQT